MKRAIRYDVVSNKRYTASAPPCRHQRTSTVIESPKQLFRTELKKMNLIAVAGSAAEEVFCRNRSTTVTDVPSPRCSVRPDL